MKKILLSCFFFLGSVCIYGQIAVPDTIYQFETITVYDTLYVHDTLRIKSFFADTTATFSEKDIILHEKQIKKEEDMKMIKLLPIIMTMHGFASISAQEQPVQELSKSPMQLSFVYPLGFHFLNATEHSYGFTFCPLYSQVGGVDGFAFSGIMNHVTQRARGVEMAGIINMVENESGVWQDANGAQLAGVVNLARRVNGLQAAGVVNMAQKVTGAQAAGVVNLADSVQGSQHAGVCNIANRVEGTAFAGVFNRVGSLRGVAFSVWNDVDTIENGAAFGVVNIVRRGGYRAFSLSFADYMNVGAGFSMGHRNFFTSFYAGANFVEDKLWVAGFGIGFRRELSSKWDFQPECSTYTYFPQDFRNIRSCSSNHLKANFIWKAGERFGVVLSPSIYHVHYESPENYTISAIPSFFSASGNNHFGVGLSVGLMLWN